MNSTAAAVLVFAGVAVVVTGLGYVLYTAGDSGPSSIGGPDAAATGPRKKLRTQPDPVHVETPILPGQEPRPEPPGPDGKARFSFPEHPDLDMRNWKEIATTSREFDRIVRDRAESGTRPTPENMKLTQETVQKFWKAAAMPPRGWDESKKLTPAEHPHFSANRMAAVLVLDEMPLDEAQAARIDKIARECGAEFDAIVVSDLPEDGSYRLESTAARARVIDRFFGDAFKALTPAQAEALAPEKWRDRIRTDAYSSGIVLGGAINEVSYSDPAKLVEVVTARLASELDIADRAAEIAPIVTAWAGEITYEPPDFGEVRGRLRNSRALRDIDRTVALLKRVADELKLPPEKVDRGRALSQAFVPMFRPQ
jgi:hypothetical protein